MDRRMALRLYVAAHNRDEDTDWQQKALCAQTDPDAFFPDKGGSTREAKRTCSGCEVRADCLEYALDHDERFGIWGGLSERERRRIKRGPVAEQSLNAVGAA
jgi:WhiB family redox-sensing transcriptional regulator